MTLDLPLVHSSASLDQSTDLSQVFKHPQGLVAARAIAKSLIVQSRRSAQPIDPSPPQTGSSSNLGFQSTPDMDSNNTNVLNILLAFSENQSQSSGEGSDVARVIKLDPRDENHEAPDRCTLFFFNAPICSSPIHAEADSNNRSSCCTLFYHSCTPWPSRRSILRH